MKILLTSSGGPLVPMLTKFLKRDHQLENIQIIGIDQKKIKKNPYLDKFYCVKIDKKISYISSLLKICKKNSVQLVIPYSDKESILISKHKSKFSKNGVKILVNNQKALKIISNKYYTYKKLKKSGIAVPKFKLVDKMQDFLKSLKYFKYPHSPIVIKPNTGIGGRGVIILNGKKNKIQNWVGKGKREKVFHKIQNRFSKKIFKYGPILLTEALSSPAYDIDSFSFNNKFLFSVRKRVNPSGIPYRGNYLIKNKKIENYCKKILKILKINFLVDIDLLTLKKKPILLEINPRPSGSIAMSYYANYPFFSYVIAKTFNKKYRIDFKKIKYNKKLNISKMNK